MANLVNTLNPNATMPDLGVAPVPNVQLGMDPMPAAAESLPQLPDVHPMVRGANPLEQNIANDQQQLQKVRWAQQNPWGTANNHPGTFGKIAHVLSTAGQIAGDIFAPSVMALAPGTNLNRDIQGGHLAHELNAEQEEESQNQGRDASTQATNLANANEPTKAKLGNELTQSEIDKNNTPPPVNLNQAYGVAVQRAINAGRDPHTDPVVQQLEDAIVGVQPGQNKPEGAPKTIDVVPPGSKNPHTMGYDPATKKFDIDEGEHYEKPTVVNVNAGNAALDRETKQYGTPYQKGVDSANAQLEKIADARAMINGNAEAQGLGIPKVLTALVGGQGTGVRITQAELQSIAHARGLQGDVEGTLSKLAGKGALSHDQQRQLTQIMDDVKARIEQKQAIHSGALDAISGASSREQIIQADKDARKKLSDLETGGASPAGGTPSGAMMFARDPSGKLHQAPAGTPLPPGWKEGR